MRLVGVRSENFSFPLCNSFVPTIHRGKVCYTLSDRGLRSQKGMKKGLMLMIDNNYNRSVTSPTRKSQEHFDDNHINFDLSTRGNSAEIYIPTLTPFSGFRPGRYVMTSVKKMTGTDAFLDFPDEVKECQNMNLELCQSSNVLQKAIAKCDCIPWAIRYGKVSQKNFLKHIFKQILL